MYGFLYILLSQVATGEEPSGTERSFLPVMAVGGLALLGFMMILSARRRVRRNQERMIRPGRKPVSQSFSGRDMYNQVNELIVELAELSRQINGQIDTRLAKLEIILREADEKLARLEEATGKKLTSGAAPNGPDPLPQKIFGQTKQVLEMAEQGMSPVAIAQEMDRPVGEIELILALQKRRASHEGES